MINTIRFNEILAKFKEEFAGQHWENEKFKWQAVKRFQDVWDINAPDFADMFMKATDQTFNLLTSMRNFPRGMINNFAKIDPEFTRNMFIHLFDESIDLVSRYQKFATDAEMLRRKYGNNEWKNHYQNLKNKKY